MIRSSLLDDMAAAFVQYADRSLMAAAVLVQKTKAGHDALWQVVALAPRHGQAVRSRTCRDLVSSPKSHGDGDRQPFGHLAQRVAKPSAAFGARYGR